MLTYSRCGDYVGGTGTGYWGHCVHSATHLGGRSHREGSLSYSVGKCCVLGVQAVVFYARLGYYGRGGQYGMEPPLSPGGEAVGRRRHLTFEWFGGTAHSGPRGALFRQKQKQKNKQISISISK